MPGYQRVFVVATTATGTELQRLRQDLRRDALVLTAPTPEAEPAVRELAIDPQVELLLAPVRYPQVDRGHRLDDLVRGHALHDRFRDLVVITDAATATLLLRVLAPDQLASGGAVTVVGLARGNRPTNVGRAVVVGLVMGAVIGVMPAFLAMLALPGAVALLGLVLLLVPDQRHLGQELLLAAVIAVAAGIAVVAGSARFPAGR